MQVLLPTPLPQEEAKIDFNREKSALPKLQIKGGDATIITRTIHKWLQRTSTALNTWSASAVQLWHNAVALAKAARHQWTMMAPSQRALQTGLPSTGYALPAQFSVLVAIVHSDLRNHCLPDKIQSLAIQEKGPTQWQTCFTSFSKPVYLETFSKGRRPCRNRSAGKACQNSRRGALLFTIMAPAGPNCCE